MKAWMSGNVAGTGTFRCTDCDYPVSLDAVDELPTCPNCGGDSFVRASLFTTAQTTVVDLTPETDDRTWLDEVREGLTDPGQYLAYRTDEDEVVIGRHRLYFIELPAVSGVRYTHLADTGTA